MNDKASVQGFDISNRSAAIIGCGGLGTNAAVHLSGSGIGRLWLCDFDVVQLRNLNRQFLFTPQDAGQKKCHVLAQRLRAFAPDVAIETIDRKIETVDDLQFANEAELLILAVDNIAARKVVCVYCEAQQTPLINGGVDGNFGTAYLYLPGKTPDLDTAGGLLSPQKKPLSPSPAVGIIGALQAKLAIDYFCKHTASQGVLLCYDGMEIQALPLQNTKGADAS